VPIERISHNPAVMGGKPCILEILSLHGIRSVFDVIDRPTFPWDYCLPLIAHARALTVDCCANGKRGHSGFR